MCCRIFCGLLLCVLFFLVGALSGAKCPLVNKALNGVTCVQKCECVKCECVSCKCDGKCK